MSSYSFLFFFFNDTATTEIYTLSLHDALPIFFEGQGVVPQNVNFAIKISYLRSMLALVPDSGCTSSGSVAPGQLSARDIRSEEHTSELQSQSNLVCRLLLEKKKNEETKVNSII